MLHKIFTGFFSFCRNLGQSVINTVVFIARRLSKLRKTSPLPTATKKKNTFYPLSKIPGLKRVDAWMAKSEYLSSYRSTKRLIYLASLLMLIVVTPLVWWRVGHQPETAQAGWWDDTWRYRQMVSVTNGSGSDLTDFQISITLDTAALITAGKLQSDCDDIRISDINGKILPFWIETGINGCNTANTAVWTKIPQIPTSGAVVYIYYGNSQAINVQNGNDVFEFFDDFSGSSIDSSKWTQGTIAATTGTDFSVSSGSLNGGNSNRFLQSLNSFTGNYTAEARIQEITPVTNGFMTVGFFGSASNSFGILSHNSTSYSRNDSGWSSFAFNATGQWSRDSVTAIGTSATYSRTGETSGSATATLTNSGLSNEALRISARYDVSAYNQNFVASWDWIFVRKAISTQPSVASPTNEELSPAPIGYWKFDEGSGTSAGDSSGNGKTGAFLSVPVWKSEDLCVSGKCLSFDNVDDGVSIAGENLTSLSNYTMCSWINPKGNHKNYTGTIFSSGNWNNTHWAFGINQANTSIQTRKADGVNSPSWSYTVPLNQWTFVCLTRSGSTVTAYANGVQVGSPYTGTTGNLISNATNTTIGRETYAGGYFAFNGWIDESKIYPYARTPDQIKADYSAGKAAMATNRGNQASLGSNTLESGNNLANGLVGYWKMDEATANTCTGGVNDSCDSSGSTLDGAWAGSATSTTGKFGNGVSFDNAGDVISLGSPATLDFGNNGAFTFAGWIKPTTLANYDAFISKNTAGRTSPYSYMTVFMADGGLGVYNGSNWLTLCGAGSVVIGNWQHVVFNYNGTTITGYVNGVSCGSIAFTYTDNVDHEVSIGSWYSPNTLYDFHGVMDEIRMYNRALSLSEVQAISTFSPGSMSEPVAYWKFDEGYGTTSTDSTSYARTVTLSGTTKPVWSNEGKIGKSLFYDGTASYTAISQDPVSGLQQMTMSAWVKVDPTDTTGPIVGNVFGYYYRYGIVVSTGVYRALFRSSGGTGVLSSNVAYSGGWDHVLLTYDNGATAIYVNGQLANTGTFANAPLTQSTNTIHFGTHSTASGDWFKGGIDEVKIYDFPMTADQVKAEYNQGKAQVLGSSGTESDGVTPSFSASREYCVPGDTATCNPPVAEYKFDENTGTAAIDTSGNGLNGSFKVNISFAPGKKGSGLSFDGNGDYIVLTSPFSNGTFSISGWINPSISEVKQILDSRDSASDGFLFGLNSTGKYRFRLNGSDIDTVTSYPLNQWSNYQVTYDGSNIRLYVNGILDTTYAQTTTLNITNNAVIGAIPYSLGSSLYHFQGKMDELRIYDYARTPAQIAWEYNQGAPIAHYKFDECQGTTIYNSALNGNGDAAGNNGTLYIGATAPNTTPGTCATSGAWADGASGKLNSAMDFDGVDDYVAFSSDISAASNNSSVSWWSKRSSATYQTLFSRLPNSSNNQIEMTATNGIRLESYTNNLWSKTLSTNINTADDIWHHYLVVLGATDTKLYVDGVLADTDTANTDTNPFLWRYIGYKGTTGYGDWYSGLIDDVRIYNYALTADQVQTVYNNGAVSFR